MMKSSLLLVALFLLFACKSDYNQEFADMVSVEPSIMMSKDAKAEESVEYAEDERNGNTQTEQKLIKNGSIDFETKSVNKTQEQLIDLVKQYDGYLSNQNQSEYGDRISNSLQVRVPAERFDDFFKAVIGTAHRVDNQNINVSDVTQEFIDVESRIQTKKELEARYITLLSKAKNVEEMLTIERELGSLRSDIESMEGRLNYLKNQTSYSTVYIEFYQITSRNFGFGGKFMQAFANGWQVLLSFIIGVITLWPFWIILGLLIYLARRFNLFSRKKTH